MKSKQLIIFIQAPKDVPFALKLYEQNERDHAISIFVVNVKGIYKFISSLKLNLNGLTFIPYLSINLKKFASLYKERNRIKYLWELYFKGIKKADVYFFAEYEDYLTAAFIHRLAKNKRNKIVLIAHSVDNYLLFPIQNRITFRTRAYLLLLRFLTGINFKAVINEARPEFPIEKYSIKKIKTELDQEIFKRYSYKLDIVDNQRPNILFFISPHFNTFFDPKLYNEKVIRIINLFKQNGFNVVAKGHPRSDIDVNIKSYIDMEIPNYFPGEFIDTSSFKLCVGIYSNVLCYFARDEVLPTYSLIQMMPVLNRPQMAFGVKSMQIESDNKILFCDSEERLTEILLNYQ